MLKDRDIRFLDELSLLVKRKIDYSICFGKTFMSSIRSFAFGFMFADYYTKNPKTIIRDSNKTYPAQTIDENLSDFITKREIEKGKTSNGHATGTI